MRSSPIAVLVVLSTSTAAHAMGSDRMTDLVAWSRDGSAALIRQSTFRDGDKSLGYSVVSASGKPVSVGLSVTTRDDGKDVEQADVASCVRSARDLAKALAAAKISGVTVHEDRCKQPGRDVVTVSGDAARDAEQSWVALPQGRTATARERTAWSVVGAWKPFPMQDDCSGSDPTHDTVDVASRSDKLVLVFTSWTCNSPIRVTVKGFAPGKTGYVDANIWAEPAP